MILRMADSQTSIFEISVSMRNKTVKQPRVLAEFPRSSTSNDAVKKSSKRARPSDRHDDAVLSIWKQIEPDTSPPGDLHTDVFNRVHRFCKDAHATKEQRLPVGSLFTGALVPCHEVDPLKLLTEVLRVNGCDVFVVTSEFKRIGEVIEACNRQLTKTSSRSLNALADGLKKRSGRPLVLLIESVEATDAQLLEDVMFVLIRNRSALPATVLTGLSTRTCIDAFLPSDLCTRLVSQLFALMSPRQSFEKAMEQLLLSPSCPGLVIGPSVMHVLNDLYLYHHFTMTAFKTHLKQALLDHVRDRPMGCLLEFMSTDVVEEGSLESWLPDDVWASLSPGQVNRVPELMKNGLRHVCGWKTMVLCVYYAAEAMGVITRGSGYSLRELYMEAVESGLEGRMRSNGGGHRSSGMPKVAAWCAEGDSSQKIPVLTELITRMTSTARSFGSANDRLVSIGDRLDNHLKLFSAASDHQTETSRRRITRLQAQNNNPPPPTEPLDICSVGADIDGILAELVHFYGQTSPASVDGNEIFCLTIDTGMKTHLAAAPRIEIPELLNDAFTQRSYVQRLITLLLPQAWLLLACLPNDDGHNDPDGHEIL